MGDFWRENARFSGVMGIFKEKTRDFRLNVGFEKTRDFRVKWEICEEETRGFRLNGGFPKRKRVICGLNAGLLKRKRVIYA